MNNPTSSPSPLSCRLARTWNAVTGRRPGHAASCPHCQAYFAAAEGLECELRREAARTGTQAPAELERGISRAVAAASAEAPVAASAAAFFSGPRMALAGAALAVALVAVALVRIGGPRAERDSGTDDAAELVAAAASFSDQWWNSLLPSATDAVQNNDLHQEMSSVVTGARSAIDFLALNFLPTPRSGAGAPPPVSTPPTTGKS